MNTLGIDLRCLPSDGSAGSGIAHAARAVTLELIQQFTGTVILYLPRGAAFPSQTRAQIVPLDDGSRVALLQGLKSQPCEQLFVPSGAIPVDLPVPAIPWIHDCDIFDHPEWFPQSWLQRFLTTRMFLNGIRRASKVFAVSEYTKKSIQRLVPELQGRITVTGEGGDDTLSSLASEALSEKKHQAAARLAPRGISRRFVLMLGTVEPRKNIPFICNLWPEVARQVPGVDLVVAGQDGWKTKTIRDALYACAAKLEPLDSRGIRLKEFSEDERRDLLLAADVVLVPSFSEGFGLVALEGVQAGTPVLASSQGALPEIMGKGEWLIDPKNESAWTDQIVHLLESLEARQQMVEAQSYRKALFSWEKAASMIVDSLK